jgi:hypothetical protein
MKSGSEMMQILLGQAPLFFWWFLAPGALILLLAWAVSVVVRAYAKLIETRANREVALAALERRSSPEAIRRQNCKFATAVATEIGTAVLDTTLENSHK